MPNQRRSDETTAGAPRRRAARGFYTRRAPRAGQGGPGLMDRVGRMVPVRTAPMLIALLIALMLLASPLAATETTRDPGQFFFDQTFGDYSEELEQARAQGKTGLLLMFEMDECPFCHRMKNTVLNRPEVQDYFKEHFLIFSVDVEGDVEVTDFAGNPVAQKDMALKQFRVRATPVFAFFDLDGNLVARYTGATGDSDEFMLLGRYVIDGVYREMTFSQYKRNPPARTDSAETQAAR